MNIRLVIFLVAAISVNINTSFAKSVTQNIFATNTAAIASLAHFPSCSLNKDDYYLQQSGKDKVQLPIITKGVIALQANEMTGQESGVHYARGNVVAYQESSTIVADWLTYNQQNSHTQGGNLIWSRRYDVVHGKWIDYYMDVSKGVIKDANAKDYKTDMYVAGEKFNLLGHEKYQAVNGYFTSCDPKHPNWHIRTQTTNIDYQNNQGNARGAIFYAKDLPIMYLPYFQFPLGRRRSGFLTPEFGGVGSGMYLGIPYYFNLAPNYDMTLEPKIYTADGIMLTDQFRYLGQSYKGEAYTEQLPSSWQNGQYRYYWHLVDDHMLAKEFSVGYHYDVVSDNNYFTDFGNFYTTVSNINLEQSVYAKYQPQWGLLGIKLQNYQTLQPEGQPATSPIYAIEPEVDFNINPQSLGVSWLKLGGVSQYASFANPSLQSGQREMIYPSLTMPFKNKWGFLTPKFGLNYTHYDIQPFYGFNNSYYMVDREVPITSLDGGLIFERATSFGHHSFIQTLEPRLFYLYVPAINQANIPVFDSAEATPNLNQLFNENRFAGYDRINSANDLTLGLRSRLINDNNGEEVANWGVGYRYYLTPENDLIYGSYNQFQQLYQPNPNLITELSNKWGSSGINSNLSYQYSTLFQEVDAYSVGLQYNKEAHKVFNLRYSYQYKMPLLYYAWVPGQQYATNFENQYAIDTSFEWPLFSEHWLLDGRTNYDFTQQRFLNALIGLEYNSGCYAISLLYENYITNLINAGTNQVAYTNAYFLQVSLKGLANIGNNGDPRHDLQMNIPGYVPITNIH